MATVYSLNWKVFDLGYVATINHTISADNLLVYLRGSVGKDNVRVRNVEINARLTTSPFVLKIENVEQTIAIGGYSSYNLSGISDRLEIIGGAMGDTVTLNLYSFAREEFR